MSQRDKLIELVNEGILDPMMALEMCARWMTNEEVGEMLDAHELSDRFLEDDEDAYEGDDDNAVLEDF